MYTLLTFQTRSLFGLQTSHNFRTRSLKGVYTLLTYQTRSLLGVQTDFSYPKSQGGAHSKDSQYSSLSGLLTLRTYRTWSLHQPETLRTLRTLDLEISWCKPVTCVASIYLIVQSVRLSFDHSECPALFSSRWEHKTFCLIHACTRIFYADCLATN